MKRISVGFMVLCLLVGVTAGLFAGGQKESSATGGAASATTLHYMWWTPSYKPYVTKAVQIFEQKNPGVTVQYDTLAYDPYWQKIQTLFASGNPPDVFDMSIAFTWDFAKKGSVLDLESYVSKNINDYYKKAIDNERYPNINGDVYAMPYQWVASLLFYNKDLFDAAGVPYPNPSWTYDTLISTAKKLTNPSKGEYGFFANGSHTFLDSMIKAYGGQVLDPTTFKCQLTQPVDIKVIQMVADMMQKDKSAPIAASYSALLASGGQMFRSGKIAMTIDGSYMIDSFKDAPFKWDATMVPSGPVKRSIYGGPDGMSIAKTTKYPDASWKFVQFMTGPDRPKETWIPGGVPIVKSVAESQAWIDYTKQWLSDPKVLLDSGAYMEGADFTAPNWLQWRNTTMNEELASAFVGGKSVPDAAAAACTAIDKILGGN